MPRNLYFKKIEGMAPKNAQNQNQNVYLNNFEIFIYFLSKFVFISIFDSAK